MFSAVDSTSETQHSPAIGYWKEIIGVAILYQNGYLSERFCET